MRGFGKKKLLVIDDDMAFCRLVAEYFKSHGYQVDQAGNVEDAIRAFQRVKPKVVLLDFNMPLINGDQFLPLLQQADPDIRAIVISGELEVDVEQKFRGLGYFAYFEKGTLSLEKLKAKIDEALDY